MLSRIFLTVAMGIAASPALAQMVTGDKMTNFREAFGLAGAGVKVEQTSCEIDGKKCANVLWPGERATFHFKVTVDGGYQGPVKVDVVQYGTHSTPGDIWKPVVFKIANLSSSSLDIDLPAGGGPLSVTPKIGDTFGGYALIFDVPGKGRFFGTSCCRTVTPEPGKVFMPAYAMDLGWPFEMSRVLFNTFKKLGIKGARVEGGYNTLPDAHVDWAMENDVTLMMTVGAGSTPRTWEPLGRTRPFLHDDGSMIQGAKEDYAWMPQYDDQFKKYLKDVVSRYGWPKGPVNAVELWNEPWEGVSISGWGADMIRYREIYKVMAQAVLEARKEAGVRVMIGGACSSSNTRDKLFCDGKDDFLPILDFVSIHYQPLSADPAITRKWMSRKGDYGRVRVWDTESWVGNSDDRVASVIASMRSMGQDRTAGIYAGNVDTSHPPDVSMVWSPGASVAAANKLLGQRDFKEILFRTGLPFVYVFDGLPRKVGADRTGPTDPDDGTIVVVGDLGQTYDRNRCLFRSVSILPDARMEIDNSAGHFVLYDFYGNPVHSGGPKIQVPVNGLGYYLRSDGSPGSFKALVQAVRSSRTTGVDPVEIIARDMTAPLASHPSLRIQLTNVLNRPVAGKLTAGLEGMTVSPAEIAVTLKPGEVREFPVAVSGNESPDNNYRLTVVFDSPDGKVEHAELMHVNTIARRTIKVDGSLEDWQGVVPQTAAGKVGTSLTEKAYLPFKDWSQQPTGGSVKAYLAYDSQYFYFAATVPGVKPTIRYGKRDDDSFFYPETVTDNGKELTWPVGVRRYTYRKDPDLPAGHNVQIAFNVIPEDKKPDFMAFPAGTMPHYCCYQDTDYEFALNQCEDGGTEVFCLNRVGAPLKHFYPRQPTAPIDGGPVAGAQLVFNGNTLECAIPLSIMPEVAAALKAAKPIKFSFRSNEGGLELAAGRSVSKDNPMAFHVNWTTHWANELEFGVER